MSTIVKQLKLTAVPRGSNPIMDQRMRLIRRLEEQKQLASDPHYVRVTRRWTGKGDARRQIEKTQRVSAVVEGVARRLRHHDPAGRLLGGRDREGQGRHCGALAGQGARRDRDAGRRGPGR
jgi:hypothetical protein